MFNKNLMFFMVFLLSISFFSCSDKSSNDSNPVGIGGLGGTGGTGGDLTFTMGNITKQEDADGDGTVDNLFYFTAAPSAAVRITKVSFSLPAQQYNNSFTDDGTTEYAANAPVEVVGFLQNEITSGQQWTFIFEGTLAVDGKAFNVTSNYTVP